jgi:hypothetical protein
MQRTGGRPGVYTCPSGRLPVAFQRVPHRPPVLRGRLHHDLFDLLRDQPLGEEAELSGRRAELSARKVPTLVEFHIRDHHRQHRLVHVNSRDPIGHSTSWTGAESAPKLSYSGSRAITDDAHLFAQACTLRIIQYDGVSSSIV